MFVFRNASLFLLSKTKLLLPFVSFIFPELFLPFIPHHIRVCLFVELGLADNLFVKRSASLCRSVTLKTLSSLGLIFPRNLHCSLKKSMHTYTVTAVLSWWVPSVIIGTRSLWILAHVGGHKTPNLFSGCQDWEFTLLICFSDRSMWIHRNIG
jgi:hypothetical protein